MQAVKSSVVAGATKLVSATGDAAQSSIITVVALFVLPLVVSILTLRAVVNKDSYQNYNILSLVITASYLVGVGLYLVILRSGMDADALLTTLLALVMICVGVLVATGGAATLAWDAESSLREPKAN
jgi:hypothetical protein